ncbi:hypothetical protein SSYRP_v1c07000 [Spiroplasma syrphidicola EA-1]|uniref:BIG2 domain-containing protein n=1 Tax=Spiroplasma syrphidicola EA-1 TaxID=1276229 RepID=R4UJI0_9MOLU|nr:lipoprotein [Spiroplasma syrphidicola]AGM26290.1 hypothetical protein SSYRP_v1c07000 [Spiroplasma syrphidicola EA-1]
MKKLLSFLATFGIVATTTTSVVACGTSNPTTDKTAINLDSNSCDLKIYESINIKITNKTDLKNIQVNSKNDEIAIVGYANGVITVTGRAAGVVLVEVTADNMKEKSQITVTVLKEDEFAIKLSNKNLNLTKADSDTVEIMNFEDLKNVTVSSENEDIATVEYEASTGILTISSKNLVGETNISIAADNSPNNATIKVTVNKEDLYPIELDNSEITFNVEQNRIINVKQYSKFVNLKVSVVDENIATASYDASSGQISITANKTGNTKIWVSADNATTDKAITVSVITFDIKLDLNYVRLQSNDYENINIINFRDLKNVSVRISDDSLLKVGYNPDNGQINVNSMEKTGKVEIYVSADNANSVTINVKIENDIVQIRTDINQLGLTPGYDGVIRILNYSELRDVNVAASDPSLIKYEYSEGYIKVVGVRIGWTYINISTSNAGMLSIYVQISPTYIQLSLTQLTNLPSGESATVQIINYSDLRGIYISSSDERVAQAKLDGDIITVYAKEKGTTFINVTALSGGLAQISVTVS